MMACQLPIGIESMTTFWLRTKVVNSALALLPTITESHASTAPMISPTSIWTQDYAKVVMEHLCMIQYNEIASIQAQAAFH